MRERCVNFSIRISETKKRKLDEMARETGINRNQIVNLLIDSAQVSRVTAVTSPIQTKSAVQVFEAWHGAFAN